MSDLTDEEWSIVAVAALEWAGRPSEWPALIPIRDALEEVLQPVTQRAVATKLRHEAYAFEAVAEIFRGGVIGGPQAVLLIDGYMQAAVRLKAEAHRVESSECDEGRREEIERVEHEVHKALWHAAGQAEKRLTSGPREVTGYDSGWNDAVRSIVADLRAAAEPSDV